MANCTGAKWSFCDGDSGLIVGKITVGPENSWPISSNICVILDENFSILLITKNSDSAVECDNVLSRPQKAVNASIPRINATNALLDQRHHKFRVEGTVVFFRRVR